MNNVTDIKNAPAKLIAAEAAKKRDALAGQAVLEQMLSYFSFDPMPHEAASLKAA